jgi:hypothetical protein
MIEPGPLLTPGRHVDYDTALLYSITCTYNDHYDWRVPTDNEWIRHNWIISWSWNESRMARYSRTPHEEYDAPYDALSLYALCLVRTIND